MKRYLTVLVLLLLFLTAAHSQTLDYYDTYHQESAGRALGGEHATLIWEGTVYLPKTSSADVYTDWIQYGWSPDDTLEDGSMAFHANPEVFALDILLDSYPTNNSLQDSAILVSARFEYADSSSATIPYWNADSTNLFIADGNYNHAKYGDWMYEDIPKTAGGTVDDKGWTFNLRVTRPGGCLRLVFAGVNTMDDSTRIRYRLRGEN